MDFGGAMGSEGSDDQSGTGAEVCGADCASVKFGNSVNHSSSVLSADGCTKPIEFMDVLKAFREDAIGDGAGSLSDGKQSGHLGLQVGGDPGERFGCNIPGHEAG